MKRLHALGVASLICAPLVVHAETGRGGLPAVSAEQLAEAQSTVIFTFADSVAPGNVRSVAERAARAGNGRIKHIYSASIKGFSAQMNFQAAQRLVTLFPEIVAVERDQIATTLHAASPSVVVDSTAPWGTTRVHGQTCGRPYSRVWVLDTGIDLTHPALNVADAALHFTAYTSANDKNGHGTHVAGTIGARDMGTSAKGVAPGTPVVPVKVLSDRGSGAYSTVIAGIDWVANQRKLACPDTDARSVWCDMPEAWVANMSLGGPKSDSLNAAVTAAAVGGIRFALAAGNERADANTTSPASVNHPNIFTVAASTSSDGWAAEFSNYGAPPVDYIAPGVGISSSYPGGTYRSFSGTSMASPHVAGILTLAPDLKSNGVGATPLYVGSVLYADGTVTRVTGETYPLASYEGAAPQGSALESECIFHQPLYKPTTTSTGGSKGGPKR